MTTTTSVNDYVWPFALGDSAWGTREDRLLAGGGVFYGSDTDPDGRVKTWMTDDRRLR